jgi:hypothetical protein
MNPKSLDLYHTRRCGLARSSNPEARSRVGRLPHASKREDAARASNLGATAPLNSARTEQEGGAGGERRAPMRRAARTVSRAAAIRQGAHAARRAECPQGKGDWTCPPFP